MTSDLSINILTIINDLRKYKYLSFLIILLFLMYAIFGIYKDINKKKYYYSEIKFSPISFTNKEKLLEIVSALELLNEKCLLFKNKTESKVIQYNKFNEYKIDQSIIFYDTLLENLNQNKIGISLLEDIRKNKFESINNYESSIEIYLECGNQYRLKNLRKKFTPEYLIQNFISQLSYLTSLESSNIKLNSGNLSLNNVQYYVASVKDKDIEAFDKLLSIISKTENQFIPIITDGILHAKKNIEFHFMNNLSSIIELNDKLKYKNLDEIQSSGNETISGIENSIHQLTPSNFVNKQIIKENVNLNNRISNLAIIKRLVIFLFLGIFISFALSLSLGSLIRSTEIQK